MKRILFSVFIVFALLLVACGAESTPTPPPTSTAPPSPTATRPPAPTPTVAPTATSAPPTATPAPTATPTRAAPTSPPTPSVKTGGTLRTSMQSNPAIMDLHSQRVIAGWNMVIPTLNYLVENYQQAGVIRPDLSDSWSVSADGKTWSFHLVGNAVWSDGKRLTADDVVYSLRRIQGLEDVKTPVYKFTMDPVIAVERIDDVNVRITLSRPSGSFLGGLGAIGNLMYPKHVPISEFNSLRFVSSGAYKMVSAERDVKVVHERNPQYFKKDEAGRQLPYLDRIETFIILDASAQAAAFRTRQVDLTQYEVPTIQDKLKLFRDSIPGVQVHIYSSPMSLFFNNKPPFSDQRLRTVFQLALDRQDVNTVKYQGDGNPYLLYNVPGGAFAFTPDEIKALPGFNPATRQQDIAQANQLLDAVLKDLGQTRDTYRPTIVGRDIWQDFAVIAQDQLRRNLKWDLPVKVVDLPTSQQVQASRNFEITLNGLAYTIDDPVLNIGAYARTGTGTNYGAFSDPKVDALLDQIDSEIDPAKRKALSQQLEKIMYDLAWHVIMVGQPNPVAALPSVKGEWKIVSQDGPPHKRERVWLDR